MISRVSAILVCVHASMCVYSLSSEFRVSDRRRFILVSVLLACLIAIHVQFLLFSSLFYVCLRISCMTPTVVEHACLTLCRAVGGESLSIRELHLLQQQQSQSGLSLANLLMRARVSMLTIYLSTHALPCPPGYCHSH